VGEVNLWLDALLPPGSCGVTVTGRTAAALKLRAHFFGLIPLQRTGVRLAFTQTELRQYVKNLPTLDFHLACEIVDSYLAHPPLFRLCYPKP
jgi:hypothetical protein